MFKNRPKINIKMSTTDTQQICIYTMLLGTDMISSYQEKEGSSIQIRASICSLVGQRKLCRYLQEQLAPWWRRSP